MKIFIMLLLSFILTTVNYANYNQFDLTCDNCNTELEFEDAEEEPKHLLERVVFPTPSYIEFEKEPIFYYQKYSTIYHQVPIPPPEFIYS